VITAVLPVKSTPLKACRAVDPEPRIGAMVTQDRGDTMLLPVAACSIRDLQQDNGLPDALHAV